MKRELASIVVSTSLLLGSCSTPNAAGPQQPARTSDPRAEQVHAILPSVVSAYAEAARWKSALRAAEGRGDAIGAQHAAVRVAEILLAFPPAELDDDAIDMLRASREHANRVDMALGGRIRDCIDRLLYFQNNPDARFTERAELREVEVAPETLEANAPQIVEADHARHDEDPAVEAGGSTPPHAQEEADGPATPEATPPRSATDDSSQAAGTTPEPETAGSQGRRTRRERRLNETRPENDPERLAEEVSWADVLFAEQRYLEALETYRRVLEQYLKTLPPDDPRSRDVRFKIAKTFLALGDTRSAREMLERVAESDKTNPPIDPDARAEVEVALGHAAEAEGDLIGAHRSYFLALQHFGAARRVGTPAADPTQHALEKVSTALAEEADAAEASGDPEGADAKRAEIASTFRTLQLDSPIRIRVLESRTRAAQHRCDLETAITLRREIVQVLASREDPDRTTLAEARRELAALLRVVSDTEGAREVERQIRD